MKKEIRGEQLQFVFEDKKQFEFKPKTLDDVRRILTTNLSAQIRAFFYLFSSTERGINDDKGFNRYDATKAEDLWRAYKTYGEFTPLEKFWLKTRLPKYSNQLIGII